MSLNAVNQKKSEKCLGFHWHRIVRGLLIGAVGGAIIALGLTVIILGPASFFDNSPSIFFGTQRSASILISLIWSVIGAAAGMVLGVLISLFAHSKWKWIILGIITLLIATYFIVTSTTFFR